MPEILFKPIPSRPGFCASSEGYIYETASRRRLGQWPDKNGYLRVYTRPRKFGLVGRLVLEAFVGPCPDGKECAHDNNIRSDNRPTNLFWKTHQSNMDDQKRHGTVCKGTAKASCRLTETQVREILSTPHHYGLFAELGRQYGISQNTIRLIRLRKKWSYLA